MNKSILQCMLLMLITIAVFGCKTAEAIDRVGDKFKEGMTQAKEGMQALSEGIATIKDIDPAGLNRLIKENQKFREQILALQKELLSSQNYGVISLDPSNELWLMISDYHGVVRINAWVDDPSNRFIQNIVLPRQKNDLGLPTNVIATWLNQDGTKIIKEIISHIHCPPSMPGSFNVNLLPTDAIIKALTDKQMNSAKERDNLMNQVFTEAVLDYLKLLPQSSNNYEKHKIDVRVGNEGQHRVFIQITPEELSLEGKWRLEWQMIVRKKDGNEQQFFIGAIDSETSNYTLHSVMPPVDAGGFEVKMTNISQPAMQ